MRDGMTFEKWCSGALPSSNCQWIQDHSLTLLIGFGSLVLLFGLAETILRIRESKRKS